jgi:replication initiation protein RepC
MPDTRESESLAPCPTRISSGARRLNLLMLSMLDRADQFKGLPRGSARPFLLLAAFEEAEPYLGLPVQAFKLVSWLVKKTMPHDWEEGSRPMAWPSAREQQEYLGLSASQVKALNRTLFEAGIFVMRDNEQGKRYGRRGPDKRILQAFGFDLSPLAQRYDEFVRIAADARVERKRMKDLRRRVTLARRTVRQIGDELTALEALPAEWPRIERDVAALIEQARKATRSDELGQIAVSLERRRDEAEAHLRATAPVSDPVNSDPSGPENRPLITTTTLKNINLSDTVIASERSSGAETPVPQARPSGGGERLFPEHLGLTPGQIVELAPRLASYVPPRVRDLTWPAVVDAAEWLSGEMGVNRTLWARACQQMGREYAAVALALVSTRPVSHFTSGAGGYFAGMLRKFERGELRLAPTLWKLRNVAWGNNNQRRRNVMN